jgi:uncharacterized protein YndB with AHSA1/START domain
MAQTTTRIAATPDRVFAVLADAWTYERWVVGCKQIRDVDDGWPAPGATFHHSVGIGPLTLRDTTTVIESDPPRRIVLRARAWPAGVARVEIALAEDGAGGTDAVMQEVPVSGPPATLHNPLQDRLIGRRNSESLRRLKQLAEQP